MYFRSKKGRFCYGTQWKRKSKKYYFIYYSGIFFIWYRYSMRLLFSFPALVVFFLLLFFLSSSRFIIAICLMWWCGFDRQICFCINLLSKKFRESFDCKGGLAKFTYPCDRFWKANKNSGTNFLFSAFILRVRNSISVAWTDEKPKQIFFSINRAYIMVLKDHKHWLNATKMAQLLCGDSFRLNRFENNADKHGN